MHIGFSNSSAFLEDSWESPSNIVFVLVKIAFLPAWHEINVSFAYTVYFLYIIHGISGIYCCFSISICCKVLIFLDLLML